MFNYNKISKTFSKSRENMKWEEIKYFLEYISKTGILNPNILDIGCGSGRLLGELLDMSIIHSPEQYIGIDNSLGMIKEAKSRYPEYYFKLSDMQSLDSLNVDTLKFDYIFFIASFHHLESEQDRLDVLEKINKILKKSGYVFMTNWALKSKINLDKYSNSEIIDSNNTYGGSDFLIKLGKYKRFYHNFSRQELEYLFKSSELQIIENREYENQKNFISILKK